MQINLNSNLMNSKPDHINSKNVLIKQNENPLSEKLKMMINQRNDALTISKEGMLKLKIRSLDIVEKLEERKTNYLEMLTLQKKQLESTDKTLEEIKEMIMESMGEDISYIEKEKVQKEINEKFDDIKDIVKNAMTQYSDSIDKKEYIETSILDFMQIEEATLSNFANDNDLFEDTIIQNIDELAGSAMNDISESLYDEESLKVNELDIIEDPIKALSTIRKAREVITEIIAEIADKISKLQDEIDELLGLHVQKPKIESIDDIIELDKKKSVVDELEDNNSQVENDTLNTL